MSKAKQLIGWLAEDRPNVSYLNECMENTIQRSKKGVQSLRALFRYDESLDRNWRRPRKTLVQEFREKHPYEPEYRPKNARDLMERQDEVKHQRQRQRRATQSWGTRMARRINESMEELEERGLA